jgi:acetamidase/formamidase
MHLHEKMVVSRPCSVPGSHSTLRADLRDVNVGQQASMVTIPGEGALGDVITHMETAIRKLEGNEILFQDKNRIPTRPMIGVIGVAPACHRNLKLACTVTDRARSLEIRSTLL